MKVISVMSHKGGAGKTTLSLMLGKAYARSGQRVCVLDADFIGSGFQFLLNVATPRRYLDDFVVRDPATRPPLADMLASYKDVEIPGGSLGLIFNSRPPDRGGVRDEDHVRAMAYAGREPGAGLVRRGLEALLGLLADARYDVAVFDCHPGLAYVSEALLKLAAETSVHRHFAVFVSTLHRAHLYGLLGELMELDATSPELFAPQRSVICLNRLPAGVPGTWHGLLGRVRTEDVQRAQALARATTFENFCGERGGLSVAGISEATTLTQAYQIGGDGKIPLLPPGGLTWPDTAAGREVLGVLGN